MLSPYMVSFLYFQPLILKLYIYIYVCVYMDIHIYTYAVALNLNSVYLKVIMFRLIIV